MGVSSWYKRFFASHQLLEVSSASSDTEASIRFANDLELSPSVGQIGFPKFTVVFALLGRFLPLRRIEPVPER